MPSTEHHAINVAASVIADLSAGIYRTPAGALKELISNSFDADARNVHISSDPPHYATLTCSDDGVGITPKKFETILSLIGGSSKRDNGDVSQELGRPLIGRIGIGILSVGQVCQSFEVYSSAKGDREKFRARIDLEPYMRPEAKRTQLGKSLEDQPEVQVGQYEIETAPEEKSAHYTRVVMKGIIPAFRDKLANGPMTEGAGVTPASFTKGSMQEFIRTVSRDRVADHGAYAQLIWELAGTVPVKYMENGPVRGAALKDLRQRLESYQFRVFVDTVELHKPVLLPRSRSTMHKLFPIPMHEERLLDGRLLRVSGYVYWQNTRILPKELAGLLIRVRNVAVGGYDTTYLGYPKHEGWKFSQMTGELYVEEGLDEALNIDRASFRETDEAYVALQKFVFERLGKGGSETGIFSAIKTKASTTAKQKRVTEEKGIRNRLAKVIFGRARQLTFRADVADRQTRASGVSVKAGVVTVDNDLVDRVPRRRRDEFMGACAAIDSNLPSSVTAAARRRVYECLAAVFASTVKHV